MVSDRFRGLDAGFFLVLFAVGACWSYLSKASVRLFSELSEANWSPEPVSREVMAHDRFLVACVHRPHSLEKVGFGFRHACMLSQMLRPRAYEHFCPEGAGMFEVLVESEQRSAVA